MKKTLLLAALVLAGCATTRDVWVKDGATEQEFHMESGQCRAQAFSLHPGASMMQAAAVFSSCMQGKGWHMERERI